MPPLDSSPKKEDFEDYVAAFLQCGGFYTEKSVIDRGEEEMLELDIMAWKPSSGPPQHTLFEIKSGKWGFADIFKVLGWKIYLEPKRAIDEVYFITSGKGDKTDKRVRFAEQKSCEMGIKLVVPDELTSLGVELENQGLTAVATSSLEHDVWRYSNWLERKMQQKVSESRKHSGEQKGPDSVFTYQERIRSGFVLARSVGERLKSLYEAFQDHPKLSISVASEIGGAQWDQTDPPLGSHWMDALYKCKHPLVQVAMYNEHRARLDILKGAVEFALVEKKSLSSVGEIEFLPNNFHDAVKEIQAIDRFEKIPMLWQSFLWKWGGFFISDNECNELESLADEAGMSVEAADKALHLYDILFPFDKRWFTDSNGTNKLKLFPCQFRGLGVYYRCKNLGFELPGDAYGPSPHLHLVTDLRRWYQSTVKLIHG